MNDARLPVLVATGNRHKLAELRTLLADLPVHLVGPDDLPADRLEQLSSFNSVTTSAVSASGSPGNSHLSTSSENVARNQAIDSSMETVQEATARCARSNTFRRALLSCYAGTSMGVGGGNACSVDRLVVGRFVGELRCGSSWSGAPGVQRRVVGSGAVVGDSAW